VTVWGEEPQPRLPEQIENRLLHISQEAMNNTANHTQATRLMVPIEPEAGLVPMIVADDGLGFEPVKMASPNRSPGWGLLIMSERARALDAEYRLESALGTGTQITVEVPLKREGA
jgi:signal transduction histidine kinase